MSKKPHIVKVKGKGLDGTGVTDAIARQMCSAKGRRYMVVAEVTVDTLHDKLEGQVVADLTIDQFWPATDSSLSDHLREITRVLHQNKGLAEGGDEALPFEGDGPSPKVADVLAHGERHRPHPYIGSTLSTDDDAICDVCGLLADAAPHAAAERDPDDEHDDESDVDEHDDEADAGDEHEGDDEGQADEVDEPDEADQADDRHLTAVTNPFTTTAHAPGGDVA